MKGNEAPADRSRPRHTRYETKHGDRNGAADHHVHDHRFELAGEPGRPATAGLKGEKQNHRWDQRKVHTLMIRAARPTGLPFNPLDVPFGESRLSPGNPNADVALRHAYLHTLVNAFIHATLLGKRFPARHEAR